MSDHAEISNVGMVSTRKEQGDRAEEAVAQYLIDRGAEVVARNLRIGMLEIDIVARLRELIMVVEVRHRGATAWTTGLSSINIVKRQRIRRAGQRLWDRRFKYDATAERMRFDVASVSYLDGNAVVEYVAAAF